MIVSLGVLSIFQLILLPGLVFSQFVKLRGLWNTILVSLALSPIINYLFVFGATALGIYNQQTTLIFFGLELALLIHLTYPILNKTLDQICALQAIPLFFREYLNINNDKSDWIRIFVKTIFFKVFVLAVSVVLYYVVIYITFTNSVFTEWDAVVSWDRWAVDWYGNHLPNLTWHYPQLIPANWSLTYQFMGDSRIKFFAKNFMGIIEIYILLIIFIMGITKRRVAYFSGVIFTAWLQWLLGSKGNGYVDSAVAYFVLSSVACLLIAEEEDSDIKSTYIYIGAVIAAGAAITKQAGLWMVMAYPFLLYFASNKKVDRKKSDMYYRYLPGILAIYALIIFPWYGYKEYQIATGKEESEFGYVTSLAIRNRSLGQRLDHSLVLIQGSLSSQAIPGNIIIIFFGVLLLFAWGDRFYRTLLGFIIIPFTLLWALFFSYDTRNLNLVMPLIGLTAGIGLQNIIYKLLNFWFFTRTPSLKNRPEKQQYFSSPIKILKSIKVIYLIAPVLVIFLLPIRYPDSTMINRSINEQKQIGYPRLNNKIYEYQSKYGFTGTILTDYQYLGFLPGLEQYYRLGFSNDHLTFLKQINEASVGYALLNNAWMSPEVADYVHQNITQGTMQIIFEKDTFLFMTICHGPCH